MPNLGGGGGGGGRGHIRCIIGDVQVPNPAIWTEHTWSRKYLFYSQILVVLIHNGLSCCYLVFYEQAGHQDTNLSHFLAYPSQRPQFKAKRSHGLSFFCSQPHEQLTAKATDEGNHFRFPRPVLLFTTVLQTFDACSAGYFIFSFPFQFNRIYFTLEVF